MLSSDSVFPNPYRVTISREHDPVILDSVTFLLVFNGRPRPLANAGSVSWMDDRKHFEVPVLIVKNSRKRFEGLLIGTADGNDIEITWRADLTQKELGRITDSTNDTVAFLHKPGAER
jgi:hypothetical protein